MFGLFSKKRYIFKCPICDYEYNFKLNSDDVTDYDYQHFRSPENNASKLADFKCEFCKTPITILMLSNEKVIAIDEKWEIYENQYEDKYNDLNDKIFDIEDQMESTDSLKISKLQTQLDKLNKQLDRLEDTYANKDEKHQDKIDRWQEKLYNKLNS